MSLPIKKSKARKKKAVKFEQGKYYPRRGYYLDGEFLPYDKIHYGKKAHKLGQVHVERHRKKVTAKVFVSYCKYWAKLSGKNSYEKGIIQACREHLRLEVKK